MEREDKTVITTDANGKAAYEIDLGQYDVPITSGSRLELDASWVGPTRELIEESSTIKYVFIFPYYLNCMQSARLADSC